MFQFFAVRISITPFNRFHWNPYDLLKSSYLPARWETEWLASRRIIPRVWGGTLSLPVEDVVPTCAVRQAPLKNNITLGHTCTKRRTFTQALPVMTIDIRPNSQPVAITKVLLLTWDAAATRLFYGKTIDPAFNSTKQTKKYNDL